MPYLQFVCFVDFCGSLLCLVKYGLINFVPTLISPQKNWAKIGNWIGKFLH